MHDRVVREERPHESQRRTRVGDVVDFWRVEAIEPGRHLRLRAEMRLPGEAWLEWRCSDRAGGGSVLEQRALFRPRGLAGRAYWYAVAPFHLFLFGPLARRLVREAEATSPRLPAATVAR